MAGDAAITVLGSIIEKAITPVVDAIVRHLGYLFCYNNNIKNLVDRVAKLEKSSNDADKFFEGQKRNNEETTQSSAGWLEDAKEVIKDAKEVKEATSKLNGCLNLKGRYVLSRKCAKLSVEIQTLHNKAPEGITRNTILPAGSLPGALANDVSKGYKTRMQTMDEVMKALEDPAISVIGLCGLGGVGKTTMVHEVRERAREQKLFDEVAMTTVSQNQDLFKIQGDLAEMLGLTSLKEETNIIGRADHLRKRLIGGNKVLIILDDVWSDIKLADVGIPFGSGETKCKVVITSRHTRVCAITQRNIEVRVLAIDEARALFRKTAGECVEINNLGKIADEIADECRGLPIALLTLSRALSNKDLRAWEDALTRLREGSSINIPGMEKEVYQSIKLSYDFLATEKQEEAQSLLLLCCQHPEDAKIDVEMLARYCLSLDLLKGVSEIVRARNRVYTLIEHLKSCFLLQEVGGDDELKELKNETVKVHDIVRDVCLSFVWSVKAERDKVYMHTMTLPDDSDTIGTSIVDYSKIKLLMLSFCDPHPHPPTLSRLQHIEELRVLNVFQNSDSSPIPISFQFLTNLRMLSFEVGAIHPDTMLELSMLTKLEILSFLNSHIESLPCQIGQLKNLKLLDLRCNYQVARMTPIPSGILSGLTKLEVLYMGHHLFADCSNGVVNEGVSDQACILELDYLTSLTTLQIIMLDPMGLLELEHSLFEKLERFHFGIAGKWTKRTYGISLCPLELKALELKKVKTKWILEDKVQSIVRRAVHLYLEDIKDWTDPFIIEQFVSLRRLVLVRCNELKYIIHDGDGIDNATHSGGGRSSSSVFTNLEILRINEMSNVIELCHNGHLPEGSFYKLRKLYLNGLPNMRQLWVGPTNPLCLANLTKVHIFECMALECVFPYSAVKCLVHLQEIEVRNCFKLKGIVSMNGEGPVTGSEAEKREEPNNSLIHFPKLRYLIISNSQDLRGFYNLDDGMGPPFLNPLVMLPSIEKFYVFGVPQLKQIMGGKVLDIPTLAAANWLQNLQRLVVNGCESVESVLNFEGQHVIGEENTHVVTLSMLNGIRLFSLPNLTHIFRFDPLQYISVPELRAIDISYCDSLVNVFASNLIKGLQNLTQVHLKNCESLKVVFDFEGLEVMTMREDARSLVCELQWIVLSKLPNLEHLCTQVPREIHIFQNLRILEVGDCGSLTYLFPSSIAHMLESLEKLLVCRCKGMKEVISKMNEECGELEKKIVFRSLSSVTLNDLENLSSFCSSDQQVFEFPSLANVYISQCPEVETFCFQTPREGFSKGEVGITIAGGGEIKKVRNDLVAQFPNLKVVELEGTPKFQGFYNLDKDNGSRLLPLYHPLVVLSRMENMEVNGLNKVKQIVGGRMVDIRKFGGSEWLQNLEKVEVERCYSLDSVFDFEWQQGMGENTQVVTLGKLKEMNLLLLPNLTHIFRCRKKDISIPELQALHVEECGSLVNIAASDLIKLLWNLKVIIVVTCESIKAVFDFEGLEVTREDVSSILGKLEKITLWSLPKVEHVCRLVPKEIHVFGNLKTLEVYDCGGLTYLIPSSMVHMLVNLQQLIVERCEGMNEVVCKMNREEDCGELEKRIIVGGGEMIKEAKDHQVLKFPRLKIICVGILTNLRGFYDVDHDDGRLRTLFNTLVMLPSMEHLEVHEMHQLEQIVGGEMLDSLSNLQRLIVRKCDSLVCLAASSSLKLLQNLKHVRLWSCKAIKAVLDFEGFEVNREDAQAVLSKLETIFLRQLPNLEHICRRVPKEINGFQNLRLLLVYGCDSLSYLLTSTMAHMLVNLKTLVVWNCKSMEEVIKMNEDCGKNKIIFHSLRRVLLFSLEMLSSFCSTELQEFGFPSLDHVFIVKCLAMKTFCRGHLTAEKLQGVYFDDNDDVNKDDGDHNDEDDNDDDAGAYYKVGDDKVVWKSDVNETIRHFNARANQMKSDLKEDGVDDNDADDETKEELDGDGVGDKHGVDNEYDQCGNKVLDHSGTSLELGTSFEPNNHDDDDDAVANHVDSSDAVDEHVNDPNISEEGDHDQNAQHGNEVSDHNGTTSSTCVEQGTSSKPRKALLAPDASLAPAFVSPPPPVSENNDELAHSSSPDLVKVALPGPIEHSPLASSEHSVPASDSPLQTKTEKKLSDASLSNSYDDWKSSRILIHGVYVKAEMKTTFEEILTANPDFLSGLRFKKTEIRTMFVESAISSLQCLHQYTVRAMSQEELTSIKESLDDLATSGLDVTFLERGYQRASLVIKEQQVGLAATELARLERKKVEAETAFEMARAELEAVMAQRDASKADFDALFQEVEAGKELFGGLSGLLVGSSPNASLAQVIVSPSPLVSNNNEELAYSSSLDRRKAALPRVDEIVPSPSTEQSAPCSDSPIQFFNARFWIILVLTVAVAVALALSWELLSR